MLKKKYNLQKQMYIKHNYKKLYLTSLLYRSLRKNQYIPAVDRLSYLAKEDHVDNLYFKFCTFQKLTCLISLSAKVHHRKYQYSRFFLNKQLDKLSMSNTLK